MKGEEKLLSGRGTTSRPSQSGLGLLRISVPLSVASCTEVVLLWIWRRDGITERLRPPEASSVPAQLRRPDQRRRPTSARRY